MPDIQRTIANIEAEVAIIRDQAFPSLDGETEAAVQVHQLSALRWRWERWSKVYEKGRKALDKELHKLIDIGESYPLGGLNINHVDTGWFDEKAWRKRCLENPGDDEERAAGEAWRVYEKAKEAASARESIRKSGGLKITAINDPANEPANNTDAVLA